MSHPYDYDCNCAECLEVDIACHRASIDALGPSEPYVPASERDTYRDRALVAECAVAELTRRMEAMRREHDETVGELLELVDALKPRPVLFVKPESWGDPGCELCGGAGQISKHWGTGEYGGGSITTCSCTARRWVVRQ